MNNKKPDWLTPMISFAVSATVFAVCLVILYDNRTLGVVFNIIGTAVTVTLPVIVSALILRLFPKRKGGKKIIFPKIFTASGTILLLILFLAAGIGQLLYSLSVNTYEEHIRDDVKTRAVKNGENSDIILLLDASGSMKKPVVFGGSVSYFDVALSACDIFIDNIAEECRMGGTSFADGMAFMDLTVMDSKGKKQIKEAIANERTGELDNDFETAFEESYQRLTNNGNEDRQKAIVMFSDGISMPHWLQKDFFDKYRTGKNAKNNIRFYLIRPFSANNQTDPVMLENATDVITLPFGKQVDEEFKKSVEDLAERLNESIVKEDTQEIVTPVYETRHKVVFRDVLMLYDTEPHTVPGVIVAAVCFILFAGLIQAIHFRKASVIGFVFGGIFGLAAFGVTMAGGSLAVIVLPAVFTPLLLYTLFIKTDSR